MKNKKLTKDQKEEIWKLHRGGLSTYKIAPLFNVAPTTIRYHLNSDRYANIQRKSYIKHREKRVLKMREYYNGRYRWRLSDGV